MSDLARDITAAAMGGLWILQSWKPAAQYSVRKSSCTYICLASGTNTRKPQSMRSQCLCVFVIVECYDTKSCTSVHKFHPQNYSVNFNNI